MCEDWITEKYIDDVRNANQKNYDAVKRVRELHSLRVEVNQNGFSNDTCDGCYDEDSSTGEQFHHDYPCPTIKALDGVEDGR